MKVKYTRNDNYYILTNFSVSTNPVFLDSQDVQDFKKRVLEKLSPICELYQFLFIRDQYQILVRVKSRATLEEFYRQKKKDQTLSPSEIPESTYIVSQEMANIQSGYAKRFNFKYSRFGAVFGRRYTKILLKTNKDILNFLRKLKDGVRYWVHNRFWSFKYRFKNEYKKYPKVLERVEFRQFSKNELQGRFQNPP